MNLSEILKLNGYDRVYDNDDGHVKYDDDGGGGGVE
jgi:hypothetical protein